MIAAVRVRGQVDVPKKIDRTLDSLGLRKKNQVILVDEDQDSLKGMMKQAKDYIAYGTVSEDTVEKIEEAKGEEVESGSKFSLTPPSGGFRDTRKNYAENGALGNRDDMDELLHKMI